MTTKDIKSFLLSLTLADIKEFHGYVECSRPTAPAGKRPTIASVVDAIWSEYGNDPQFIRTALIDFGYEEDIVPDKLPAEMERVSAVADMSATFYVEALEAAMLKAFTKKQTDVLQRVLAEIAAGKAVVEVQHVMRIELPDTTRTLKKGSVVPGQFNEILELAAARQEIMLVGPTGCGKSKVSEMVAESLGLPFYSLSFSEGASESHLQGKLVPTGKAGQFEFLTTGFIEAYEKGGVFLADEYDAADPNVLLVLNSALANGYFPVPNRISAPVAKRHKDFVMIAATNTAGYGADRTYTGRNALDAASLDRFKAGVVEMDYDAKVEESIVDKDVLTWGRKARKAMEASRLSYPVSTRFLRDMSRFAWTEDKRTQKLTFGWRDDEKKRFADAMRLL